MPVHVVSGDLTEELAAFRGVGRVAVDTETTGLDWRGDSLKLCQLFAPALGPMLIRIAGPAPQLRALLEDPSVIKVFHFAPFDLRFLEAGLGARTTSVVCTKAASKLLDPELPSQAHSLGALLLRHFGVELDKGAVRTSDWGSVELTDAQTEYAAGDVVSLLRLADVELDLLRGKGLSDEFAAICEYMPVDAHLEVTGIPNPLTY
ncbi:MAG: ribonuclease D [Propionibacteriaceae bacterium]|nr:ribonuclease D [Propionibacteriaceae bacterium]